MTRTANDSKKDKSMMKKLGLLILIFMIISGCIEEESDTILKAPVPTERFSAVAATAQDNIFLIGGITSEFDNTPLVEKYDPLKDEWSTMASMPTARASAAAVASGEYIYVIGGRYLDNVLATVERYDPSSNSWEEISPMPTPRWYLMAAALDGKIYTFGGIAGVGDNRKVLDVVEVYDPVTDKWTTLSSMPMGISNAAVAVLENKIYVISGRLRAGPTYSTTPRVYLYDTTKNTWHEVASLMQARTGSEACIINNKIYVIGGASENKMKASIEVYEPQLDSWKKGPTLRQPRSDLNCAVVGNSIYVMGGFSSTSPVKILKSVEELNPDSLVPPDN